MKKYLFAFALASLSVSTAFAMGSKVSVATGTAPVSREDATAWEAWKNPMLNSIANKGGGRDRLYSPFLTAVLNADTAINKANNPVFQSESAKAKDYAAQICARLGGC